MPNTLRYARFGNKYDVIRGYEQAKKTADVWPAQNRIVDNLKEGALSRNAVTTYVGIGGAAARSIPPIRYAL